jgi:NAD(P)-dependent dehydrogenase (short-subunit alcohol dehydrogenase family)
VETIRGKKALVTGAASGIGRAIALALAREGADLFLVDIDEPNLSISARDAEALGSKAVLEVCDLSNPARISSCTLACLEAFGALDILVNCAGVAHYGRADEMTAEKWNALMSVNLFAPIQFVRELMPSLVAQKREPHTQCLQCAGTGSRAKIDGLPDQQICAGWIFIGTSHRMRCSKRWRHRAVSRFCRYADA